MVQIHRKKGYYSPERESEIIFDISIEVWLPEAPTFSFLYLIEAKDYTDSIPVNRMQTFIKSVNEVKGNKAIFISSASFQSGALTTAKNNRVMLIRAESRKNYQFILHRKNISSGLIPNFKNEEIKDEGLKHVCKIVDKSIEEAFTPIDNPKSLLDDYNIRNLSKADIEKSALLLLKDIYEYSNIIHPTPLRTAIIRDYIIKKLNIHIESLTEHNGVLGACDPKNKIIWIHPSVVGTKRELFVLGHELGHLILHSELTIDQDAYESFNDPEKNFATNKFELKNPRNWIEYQANVFSAALVLPVFLVNIKLDSCMANEGLGKGIPLYLDDQPVNMRTATIIIDKMSTYFNVSKTSIRYKLQSLNRFKNGSRVRSIGEIIAEIDDDLF